MKFRFFLLALTAAAVVPVISGCGSSGSSASATVSETTPATLSRKAFNHKADLICEAASYEQAQKAAQYLEQHKNAKEADLVVPAGIPPLEKEARELRELGLPKGHEEEGEAFIGAEEKALQALKEDPGSAFSEKTNPYKRANELGKKLGLVDCALNP